MWYEDVIDILLSNGYVISDIDDHWGNPDDPNSLTVEEHWAQTTPDQPSFSIILKAYYMLDGRPISENEWYELSDKDNARTETFRSRWVGKFLRYSPRDDYEKGRAVHYTKIHATVRKAAEGGV